MKYFLTNLIFLIPLAIISQANISGIVLEKSSTESEIVLPGANVYWMDTTEGVVTNLDGDQISTRLQPSLAVNTRRYSV